MADIGSLIAQFKNLGIFDFYLPFIIMFGIFYALLTRSKIFGDAEGASAGGKRAGASRVARAVNLVVSLAASFYITAYTPVGVTLSLFLANMFGQTFVVILTAIAIIMIIYVVLTPFGFFPLLDANKDKLGGTIKVALLLLFLLGFGIFLTSGGGAFIPGFSLGGIGLPNLGVSSTDFAIILLVVVTGLIIYYVGIKGEKEE